MLYDITMIRHTMVTCYMITFLVTLYWERQTKWREKRNEHYCSNPVNFYRLILYDYYYTTKRSGNLTINSYY